MLLLLAMLLACDGDVRPALDPAAATPEEPPAAGVTAGTAGPDPDAVAAALAAHCASVAPPPMVEQVAPGVWVARGYDLANTVLIHTPQGNVVVDPGMSPARAAPARQALQAVAPGPTRAVIYTHSHIDHVGGATAWVEADTEVWATESFARSFFSQYGRFLPAEAARGARQFGQDVPLSALECASMGRRPDLAAALTNGTVLPTRTFQGRQAMDLGGVRIELWSAPGETEDALFVHLPDAGVLLSGDDWVGALPDLYPLRGSRPRRVEPWLDTLDQMRRLDPVVLVPSHTAPVLGQAAVRQALTDHRDALQWVRDAVVRGANAGQPVEELAARTHLPPHLADQPALAPVQGRLDWSVRAVYQGELGWFDGEVERLFPLPPQEEARRTVELMGGAARVREAAAQALQAGDPSWALSLLRTCERAGEPGLDEEIAQALVALADRTGSPNARAWLLQAAHERRTPPTPLGLPTLTDEFIDAIPIALLFDVMSTRLKPEAALDTHESVRFELTDIDQVWHVTVRRGVAEVVAGEPLPGTPAPVATVRTTAPTWRRVALGQEDPVTAVAARHIQIDGDPMALHRFLGRFDRRLL